MVEKELYPAYFDGDLPRRLGRRISTGMAVEDPDVDEVAAAVRQVGYDAVIERDVSYPREPWRERGRVLVKNADDTGKGNLVQAVAAYVTALRE